ncbi:MAG: rhodanese-like domain-containing protein [Balneolaceae bacterium]
MSELEITQNTLKNWLDEKRPVYILDVRPQEEREDWFIPDSHHIDAYSDLKQGNGSKINQADLPKDKPIVTVCGKGGTSLTAAEILGKKGFEAYSLQGGMKDWNFAWNTAELTLKNSDTQIIQVRRSAKGCLSYIVGSRGEAMVVDAALNPDVYEKIADRNNWNITYVTDTHIHADYLSRTRELARVTGAKHILIEEAETDFDFISVKHNQILNFGSTQIRILHTPGHTPESTSFLVDNTVLLTGDTLFTDGVGRPDLKADKAEAREKADKLFESLQLIQSLPGETIILPAHISRPVPFDQKMIQSTLSELKSYLELLQLSKDEFIETTLKRIPEPPENYLIIAGLNKKGVWDGNQPADLEAGANRCAVA